MSELTPECACDYCAQMAHHHLECAHHFMQKAKEDDAREHAKEGRITSNHHMALLHARAARDELKGHQIFANSAEEKIPHPMPKGSEARNKLCEVTKYLRSCRGKG